ncbi:MULTISPECIES: phosphatidylserine/phosphatidylglycerophosphate/cardiolipin synthase family protein [Haloferax]|uniref:Phospholipase D-like domain-containing protein n=1 Tax=Haloferax sp. Atlit-48N TaxID=2077198 RepID=A0ACD5I253_9EURY|nr:MULTISPECIES: phospholipase D-like domain-containing protein [Haloferax]MBC9985794.1 phospholipase [Haloferax sp. AS1]RDZ32831.1 phospholipase [Haloferax sp. Atlit-48N]RDZ37483.1 phospholipase [Haloferax sp. Atlit-24N]RLM38279.1 phospholipase [Haloferax sp. Atlit-109R]RLM46222.1 phospholipase [Haloferax sp. Atlit-105R]
MSRRPPTTAFAVSLAVLLAAAAVVPAPIAAAPGTANATESATAADPPVSGDPRIVAALPDPATPDDRGEFVAVAAPAGTELSLADGEETVSFVAPGGAVAVVTDPSAASNLTDLPVVAPGLDLANGGETVTLRVVGGDGDAAGNGVVADRLSYDRSREGALLERRDGAWSWWPRTLPRRNVTTHGPANATLFVLPDSPGRPIATLRAADERILLAGYVVSSARVADELVAARERGVQVEVLVEDSPVGGFPRRSARVLDRLVDAGVSVRVVGDPHSFHHPKYAVVDDAALVMTENWKPAGTGGKKSRGWGVVARSPAVAADLAATFETDASLPETASWETYRVGRSFVRTESANGSYPSRIAPEALRVDRVAVLRAPDNAESAVVARLDAAERRIDVLQPTVEADGPFVRALKRAADRGVRVRLLLGSAWYDEEENRALAERLNEWADRTGSPLSVRLARPGDRYGAIHAKGVVADDTALVGSLNWNRHSARENREVVLALSDPAAAAYFREAFAADWRASGRGAEPKPGLVAAAALAVVVGLAALRRLEFEK